MKPIQRSDLVADIVLAQKGDQGAFRRIVEGSYAYAHRLADRLLNDKDEAHDVCQETFLRVWRHLGSFDTKLPFTTWLYRIVSNLCLDRLRSRNRRSAVFARPTEDEQMSLTESTTEQEKVLQSQTIMESVRAAIGLLPPVQRLVIALRDLEGMDIDEVVAITGLSYSSVKTNLSYARARVRTSLVASYGAEELNP